jgi:hypothetical protein
MPEQAAPVAEPLTTPAVAAAPAAEPAPAAPVVAEKPAAAATMAEGGEQSKEQAKVEAKWRDDWREALASGDDKALARLKRFQSPENVFKSWAELDRKLATGELKGKLPDNPTPDDITAYRKANDIPDKAEDYGIEISETLQMLDPEKESVNLFLKEMHDAHTPKAYVKRAWDSYVKVREAELQQIYEGAHRRTIENIATLKAEWGREYDRNMRLGNDDLLQTLGSEDAARNLANKTFVDGTKLADDPDFRRYITAKALATTDEDGLLVMSDSVTNGMSLDDAYNAAINLKFTDPTKYHSEAHQKRLMQLANAKAGKSRAA